LTIPAPPPAAPAALASQPTMCLLHGDFHAMAQVCWSATFDWQFAHPHLEGQAARDAYLAAVERQMLDNLARDLR
jgi:hypothetical protein